MFVFIGDNDELTRFFVLCNFLEFLLKTVLNLLKCLILALDFDLAHVLFRLFNDVDSFLLSLVYLARNVRDDTSDDNLDEDDQMLHEDADQDDVGTVPVVRVAFLQELNQGRLLFEL